jgi:C4-dicarboxylate-specific signal transduction histidine kinase
MHDVASAFDGTAVDLSVLWIPLKHRGETVGLVYLEKNRDDRECCKQAIESFRLLAAQAATTLSNLRLAEDLEREMGLRKCVEASRDTLREAMFQQKIFETQADVSTVSRLAALGELAGSIVHEVNQPLTALSSSAEACLRWLSRDPPQVSEAQDAVRQVIREGKRAIAIVSGLEALVRGSQANLGRIRFADVLCEVLNLLRAELDRFSVIVQADIDDTLPEIRGDSFQLQQVVFNILRNSIEAMKQVNDRPRTIEISCRVSNSEIVAAFSDCGVAPSAENTDRWFDPLFTTKDSGLGMGLSICRRIIKAHQGRIWVEKNSTFGVTFAFALPA